MPDLQGQHPESHSLVAFVFYSIQISNHNSKTKTNFPTMSAPASKGVIVLDDTLVLTGKCMPYEATGGIPHGTLEFNGFTGTHPLHGFVLAIHRAFSEHRTLRLTPDDIWTVITQGIGQHVNMNHEKLRSHFVGYEGKKDVVVVRNEFVRGRTTRSDWMGVAEEWAQKARALQTPTGAEFTGRMIQSFSTTQPIHTLGYNAAVLSTLGNYMSYKLQTYCGIPRVELIGTVEDWKQLHESVQKLNLGGLGIEQWDRRLLDVTAALHRARSNAATGSVDQQDAAFFRSIYKYESRSGGDVVSGWVCQLFPYLGSTKQTNSHLFNANASVATNSFPTGLVNVSFEWEYYTEKFPMTLYSGFDDARVPDDNSAAIECVHSFAVQYKEAPASKSSTLAPSSNPFGGWPQASSVSTTESCVGPKTQPAMSRKEKILKLIDDRTLWFAKITINNQMQKTVYRTERDAKAAALFSLQGDINEKGIKIEVGPDPFIFASTHLKERSNGKGSFFSAGTTTTRQGIIELIDRDEHKPRWNWTWKSDHTASLSSERDEQSASH